MNSLILKILSCHMLVQKAWEKRNWHLNINRLRTVSISISWVCMWTSHYEVHAPVQWIWYSGSRDCPHFMMFYILAGKFFFCEIFEPWCLKKWSVNTKKHQINIHLNKNWLILQQSPMVQKPSVIDSFVLWSLNIWTPLKMEWWPGTLKKLEVWLIPPLGGVTFNVRTTLLQVWQKHDEVVEQAYKIISFLERVVCDNRVAE